MKPIPNYEGKYSVTEDGRIFSHRRVVDSNGRVLGKGDFLKTMINRLGYERVCLQGLDNKRKDEVVHRLVAYAYLGLKPDQAVDHIDGNKSNNNLSNLRVCDDFQNQGNRRISKNNTSGFKGVCQTKAGRWQMSCRIKGGRKHSWHDTKEEAARAYDVVAKQAHGVFARVNFPNG